MVEKVIAGNSRNLAATGIDPFLRGRRSGRNSGTRTLKVEGLKQSSAASNEGGGLKELITFLERKAGSVGHVEDRVIKIKKVSVYYDISPRVHGYLGGYEATPNFRIRCQVT
jgi:nuclear RNA export factor